MLFRIPLLWKIHFRVIKNGEKVNLSHKCLALTLKVPGGVVKGLLAQGRVVENKNRIKQVAAEGVSLNYTRNGFGCNAKQVFLKGVNIQTRKSVLFSTLKQDRRISGWLFIHVNWIASRLIFITKISGMCSGYLLDRKFGLTNWFRNIGTSYKYKCTLMNIKNYELCFEINVSFWHVASAW